MVFISIISEFIGRFHPVLVHLPIGILLLAAVFQFMAGSKKFEVLQPAVKPSLLFGMIAAIASCISGFLLSQNGEYDAALVSKHQWFGISVAVIAAAAYYLTLKKSGYIKWVMPLIALLIIITGHLGGTITHGEGYLTKALTEKNDHSAVANKPLPNVQEALVYNDIIQPIFQSKCYTCHGESKQKGKLRLDEPSFIIKGGDDGKVIIPGSAGESEMIKRLLLAADNKEHMPPKEKPQLSKAQIELLHWWITTGASFDKKVAALSQPEKIKPYLTALQNGEQKNSGAITDIPTAPVAKAADSVIEKLRAFGIAITPVAQGSNYLTVNFVTVDSIEPVHLQLLKQLSKQVISLKLGQTNLTDAMLADVGKLTALTRLYIDKTAITDKGIVYLKNLTALQYLNVSGTGVTANGLSSLAALKNIKQLYVYQTLITPQESSKLKSVFPNAMIDTGNYTVAFLQSDTMKVKAKKNDAK
jgi:uncharacterized membrane protein/mono/diheme cytochrome c family protein